MRTFLNGVASGLIATIVIWKAYDSRRPYNLSWEISLVRPTTSDTENIDYKSIARDAIRKAGLSDDSSYTLLFYSCERDFRCAVNSHGTSEDHELIEAAVKKVMAEASGTNSEGVARAPISKKWAIK